LRHYNGGLIRALSDVYPSIGLDPLRFKKVASITPVLPAIFIPCFTHPIKVKYRTEPNNLRKMIDNIAKRLGFDPLIAENWYSVSQIEMLKLKVLSRHHTLTTNCFAHRE
jgi:hypothetical protein